MLILLGFLFLLRIALAIPCFLCFHMICKIVYSYSIMSLELGGGATHLSLSTQEAKASESLLV